MRAFSARWVGLIVGWVFIGGLTAQSYATVEVEGYSVRYRCTGAGPTTVILEGDAGDWSLIWRPFQDALTDEIRGQARVCAYDRAGYGGSDARPESRTAAQHEAELTAFLRAAGINPPYVLVGHAYGAWITWLYAANHPDAVAGVVMLSADTPLSYVDAREMFPTLTDTEQAILGELRTVRRLNIPRFLATTFIPDDAAPAVLPAAALNEWKRAVAGRTYFDVLMDVLTSRNESVAQVEGETLGDTPLIVLSAEFPTEDVDLRLPSDQVEDYRDFWQAQARTLLAVSSDSWFGIVEDSGHYIYVDRPQAVIDAVRELLPDSP